MCAVPGRVIISVNVWRKKIDGIPALVRSAENPFMNPFNIKIIDVMFHLVSRKHPRRERERAEIKIFPDKDTDTICLNVTCYVQDTKKMF